MFLSRPAKSEVLFGGSLLLLLDVAFIIGKSALLVWTTSSGGEMIEC